ncbi:rhodanese-like domain-containing protein [Roseateles koreensis]|uniref:Rhodanese-like domain-containing protein n=1 Tax=Roseateles koreensis TaxID=2987526 RepID=A0ABT5KLP9_9BURK|nr:rhodanese-like domain-containing protein [Roseateles koreensis]MDC8783842.1 rhodanese-like domain-containing protein [Roseateles koreensis]
MMQISPRELVALCGASTGEPLRLLDVREPWEAALASIRLEGAEARLMPMSQVPALCSTLDPKQPIVCYCHHGVRSLQVVAFLLRQGFETVYNLAGGIDAWSQDIDASVSRY